MREKSEDIRIHEKFFEPYLSEALIKTRVAAVAGQLSRDFKNKNPLYIIVLNGAFVFAADLLREITEDTEMCFVRLKSYEGTQSTGKLQEIIGLDQSIEGRDVIIVEDIIDTGQTLEKFIPHIEAMGPSSLSLVTLLFKKPAFKCDFKIDYIGFEVEDLFVIGYGLDYNEGGRNLKAIYQLKK